MADENENQEQLENMSDSAEFAKMAETLQNRCKVANIPFSKDKDFEGDDYCVLELPNGRERRSVAIYGIRNLSKLLQIQFEKFIFLGDYEAVCCYEDSVIEAPIRCKVVHTKSGAKDGELELLLPFSKEAGMLQYDIDLLQFIARKVLIAASSAMTH